MGYSSFQDLLAIPADKDIEEDAGSYSWFGDDGIFYSLPKTGAPPSDVADIKASEKKWVEKMGGKKIKWLTIIDPHGKSNKASRDYLGEILPKYISAMALVCNSPLARMAANIFFKIKPQPYPTKMFSDVSTAQQWLQSV